MFRCPLVGYVMCPEIVISGFPPDSPSVFSVGPGPRMTYGTGTNTPTAIATMVPAAARRRVRERRGMVRTLRAKPGNQPTPGGLGRGLPGGPIRGLLHGLPTHSLLPSANS